VTADGPERTAVVVLGMHRSGTSLLMRLVALLGVQLGRPGDMAGAGYDNPRGYWEHLGILGVNSRLLERFGGDWDAPPALPPGWHASPSVDDLRNEARVLLASSFPGAGLWGFKDPRLCLTLPFWEPLVGPARYLLVVRHPIEVAASLARRERMPVERSLRLWQTYVLSSLRHSAGAPRLVVFHDDLLRDPLDELARVARWLGRPAPRPGDRIGRAVQEFVSPGLRHHRVPDDVGPESGARPVRAAAEATYATLRLLTRPAAADGAAALPALAEVARPGAREHPSAWEGIDGTAEPGGDAPLGLPGDRRAEQRLKELRVGAAASQAVESVVAALPGRAAFALARWWARRRPGGGRRVRRGLAWSLRALVVARDEGLRAVVRHAWRIRPRAPGGWGGAGAAETAPRWPLTARAAGRRGAHRAGRRGDALADLDGPGIAFLLVTSDQAGGIARHVTDLARALEPEGVRALVAEGVGAGFVRLRRPAVPGGREHVFDGRTEPLFFVEALRRLGVGHVHVHHLLEWPAALSPPALAEDLGVAYDCTIHDYYTICPRVHLAQPDGAYCGEPDASGCRRCLSRHGSLSGRPVDPAIEPWRAAQGRLLRGARRVFVPTEDVGRRLARYFPDVPLVVRPHLESHPAGRVVAARPTADGPLRVGVIGSVSPLKGFAVLSACARDARGRALPLAFHVVGRVAGSARRLGRLGVVLGGGYREPEVFDRLEAHALHCAFFPARIPETYSYALSIAQVAGLFPLAFDIGAIAERIVRTGWGEVLPLSASPAQVNDRLLALRPRLAGGAGPPPGLPRGGGVLRDYYGWAGAPPELSR
jgi:glycosyltransferase involved in cell wall biosynthesis